jgi:nicotinamide riboside transporter PnuC
MITYLGMSAPMALLSLIAWLRNPYKGGKGKQVKVSQGLSAKDLGLMALLTVAVTVAFYFILDFFHTANLIPSTLSVTTSFAAVYLTYRRSPYFALVYGLNDVVLIVLWAMAAIKDPSCLAVLVCFVAFLANDTYSFINWLRMRRIQREML